MLELLFDISILLPSLVVLSKKAFDTSYHPLGQLVEVLVDAYLSTYVGVGAHVRLLSHAVQEIQSLVYRIYPIIRWYIINLSIINHNDNTEL